MMFDETRFVEKVVLVTGGGSGIGQAAALQFAQAGANVFILGRTQALLEDTARHHPRIAWIIGDLRRQQSLDQAITHIITQRGRLDILVNNAGLTLVAPLSQTTDTQLSDVFETNVSGVIHLTQAALPYLKATQGTIINISSIYGHKPIADASLYAASKAALDHLTRSWALELAPQGIRVNAIAPGPTETPALEHSGLPTSVVESIKHSERERNPLKRRGEPDEIALWILWLASPYASWVTGQIIAIDGGDSLH